MSSITKNPTGPDLALIKKYAEVGDRVSPPVFVGRREEIGIVEKNCRAVVDLSKEGKKTAGALVVFRGAPGAGKTALLSHLEETRDGNPERPYALELNLEDLENTAALAGKIIQELAPAAEKMFRTRIVNNISVSGGIAGVITAAGEAVEELAAPKISFATLPKLFPPETWKRPLCLLVDEIQKVTKRHENCLQLLHLGIHGLPIVTVAAGLADSVEKLNEAMSPRLSRGNIRTLGALVPDEVRSCVKQMFDRCRIEYSADRMDGIAAKIAERSEGWPQHVSDETSALFAGLDKTRGILSAVNFREVDQLVDGYRKNSYQARQSEGMCRRRSLVANILKMIPERGTTSEHALRLIAAKANEKGTEPKGLPKGMDAEDFLDHLIHQGIFQPDETGLLSCPIPSLQSWLIKQADATNQENAVPESLPSAPGNRDVLETAVNQAAKQFEPDIKRRSGPDRDRGAER